MMIFALNAQVLGTQYAVSVENDGTGLIVRAPAGAHTARTLSEAERLAHEAMGLILRRAERPGVPWGLEVSVASVRAIYGEWPLMPGPIDTLRIKETPVARIREQWHDRDGPLKALENAIQIVRAYVASGQLAA